MSGTVWLKGLSSLLCCKEVLSCSPAADPPNGCDGMVLAADPPNGCDGVMIGGAAALAPVMRNQYHKCHCAFCVNKKLIHVCECTQQSIVDRIHVLKIGGYHLS